MFKKDEFIKIRKGRISQCRLAEMIGKTPRTIQRWETGLQTPSEHNIFLIADALDVPVSSISDLKETDTARFRHYPDNYGAFEQNIINFAGMNESEKHKTLINLHRKNGLLNRENQEIKSRLNEVNSLLNNLDAVVYQKDKSGKFTYVNELFLLYFRIPDSRFILGQRDTGSGEIRQRWHTLMEKEQKVFDTGAPADQEVLHIPALPGIRGEGLAIANIRPVFDKDGAITGIIGVIRDITGEETSNRQLYYLESAIGHMNQAVSITNVSRKSTIYVNNAVENIFGISKNQFYQHSMKMMELVFRPDRKRIAQEIIEGKDELFFRVVKSNGEIIRVRQQIYRTAIDNEIIEFRITADCTDEYKAQEIRLKLEQALNSTPDTGFYMGSYNAGLHTSLDYSFVSAGMDSIFHAPVRKYYKGKFDFEKKSLHPDFHYLLENDYWEKVKFPHEFEYKIVTPSGKIRWIREKIFRDKEGSYLGICTDITRMKKIESALISDENFSVRNENITSNSLQLRMRSNHKMSDI